MPFYRERCTIKNFDDYVVLQIKRECSPNHTHQVKDVGSESSLSLMWVP